MVNERNTSVTTLESYICVTSRNVYFLFFPFPQHSRNLTQSTRNSELEPSLKNLSNCKLCFNNFKISDSFLDHFADLLFICSKLAVMFFFLSSLVIVILALLKKKKLKKNEIMIRVHLPLIFFYLWYILYVVVFFAKQNEMADGLTFFCLTKQFTSSSFCTTEGEKKCNKQRWMIEYSTVPRRFVFKLEPFFSSISAKTGGFLSFR